MSTAHAPSFLSAHVIAELRSLAGRAKVSFPYGESGEPARDRLARVERIQKVRRGTKDNLLWLQEYGAADAEWPNAKLVTQIKLAEDDQHAEVYRVWEELTGLPLRTIEIYKSGAYKETTRQRWPAGTLPDATGVAVLSDVVTNEDAQRAERVTVRLIGADGQPLAQGVIITEARKDDESGATVWTDRFVAPPDYPLPITFLPGSWKPATLPDWKQPAANNLGYSETSYLPKRMPIAARKQEIEGSENVIVEVDYMRAPDGRVRDEEQGYRWPAIFELNPTVAIPTQYGGRYAPPWPIGADEPNGYRLEAHRQSVYPVRRFITYTIGPAEALPRVFRVRTPGVSSKILSIPEDCIHGPIVFTEAIGSAETQINIPVEDIPSSTPATFDRLGIYVLSASEEPWRGMIYRQIVTLGSEELPLSGFPDPTAFFYDAERPFTATPEVPLVAITAGTKVYAQTVGPDGGLGTEEVIGIKLYGKEQSSDGPVSVVNKVKAAPVPDDDGVSSDTFLNIREVLLPAPTVRDSVQIWEAVDPDFASFELNGQPTAGQTLEVGLAGFTRIYTFVSVLTVGSAPGEVLIGPRQRATALNLVHALKGLRLGRTVGKGTLPHAHLKARRDIANLTLVHFTSVHPRTNRPPEDYVLETTVPSADITPFQQGEPGQLLCTIPPGVSLAYRRADFGANSCLDDESPDNDAKAVPSVPAALVFYTDWMKIPPGKAITLVYNVAGTPAVRVAWQKSATAEAPAPIHASATVTNLGTAVTLHAGLRSGDTGRAVTIAGDPQPNQVVNTATLTDSYIGSSGLKTATLTTNVVVTNASTTVTSGLEATDAGRLILIGDDPLPNEVVNATTLLRAYTGTGGPQSATLTASVIVTLHSATVSSPVVTVPGGQAIAIAGDTRENELLSATTLLRKYQGASATRAARIVPLVASRLPQAVSGKRRRIKIGIPGVDYIRLKLTQNHLPIRYLPFFAQAEWRVGADG